MSQSYQPDTDKLLTELNNGVLTISFNRPEAMNALHPEMLTGVGALVDQASADNSRVAVAAMKDLYRLSQQGHAIEEALVKELDTEYMDILDTAARLTEFR